MLYIAGTIFLRILPSIRRYLRQPPRMATIPQFGTEVTPTRRTRTTCSMYLPTCGGTAPMCMIHCGCSQVSRPLVRLVPGILILSFIRIHSATIVQPAYLRLLAQTPVTRNGFLTRLEIFCRLAT